MANEKLSEIWRFEKVVTIGLILGIFSNFVIGIWYASKLDSRMSFVESWINKRDDDHDILTRMDERTKGMADTLADLKTKPDRKNP